MREMKDSGVDWMGKIPSDWSVIRFKEKYVNEKEIAKDRSSEFERLALTLNGVIKRPKDDSEGLQPKEFDSYQILHENNFIFKMIDLQNVSTSRVGLSPFTGLVSPAYIRFAPRQSDQYSRFVYYYLMSLYYNCVYNNIGANGVRSALNAKDMGEIKMPFPKDFVQRSIGSFLDKKHTQIAALIANVQSQIEKLKAYKQSLITEVVTKGLDSTVPMKDSGVDWIGSVPRAWRVAALKYFIDILPGYAFSSNDFDTEGGIPLLRGINVTPNGIRWDDTVYWNKDFPDYLKPYLLQDKDIVVGLDRPWISEGTRITRITERDLPALLLQRVCRIRVRHCIDSRWVYLWIASNAFKESLSTETTGISVPHISTKQIGDFIIALPSMEEQKEICDHIDAKCNQIDRLIAIKQSKIEKLEQYKKSLIYEYVTGKKEVRL